MWGLRDSIIIEFRPSVVIGFQVSRCIVNAMISVVSQALDLKPNYVRAWANMGISYANQVFSCAFS